jgi:hypothetical protein
LLVILPVTVSARDPSKKFGIIQNYEKDDWIMPV